MSRSEMRKVIRAHFGIDTDDELVVAVQTDIQDFIKLPGVDLDSFQSVTIDELRKCHLKKGGDCNG